MKLTHDLVTDEIKNEIRLAVKNNGRNPGFILAEYEKTPPKILRYEDIKGAGPTKRQIRFCGYDIPEAQVEDYLNWFSGYIYGVTHCWES